MKSNSWKTFVLVQAAEYADTLKIKIFEEKRTALGLKNDELHRSSRNICASILCINIVMTGKTLQASNTVVVRRCQDVVHIATS